ncbi:PKD domain-containing protein [Ornithinimicrobium faecis]|uniref:PKD domain-containing protein n=1 Tax=Ornithinimicrobium faecis TaxID=2934158 RepID=UPI0025AB6665|nr:PKD domain-containing protein [Ornithinimicrobium sp. HY1793]
MRPPATAPLPGDNRTRRAAGGVLHRLRRGWAILLSLALVTALLSSAPATAAASTSQAPIADAGADQNTLIGQSVTLDGTGSSDPDGDELSHTWTLAGPQPGNYTQSLDDSSSATPSFTPALVGNYTATLVVSDGTTDSVADTVTITVGDGIEVDWTCEGFTVTAPVRITRITVAQGEEQSRHIPRASTWTLDDTPGITSIWVSVPGNDSGEGLGLGTRFDAPAESPCAPVNEPPVANAGPDQDATTGDTVTLDGTASTDPDGDQLTYAWTLTSPNGSTATLSDATAAQPSVIPDLPGDYAASLVVNDGTTDSPADTTTITVTPPANQAPVADAQVVSVTDRVVQLDGTGSADPDGDDLTYAWALTGPDGSTAALDDAASTQPSFTADVTGNYTATLIVNDGTDNSPAASVEVSIANQAPVADAGPDQDATTGDTVTLDGTASTDPDGDNLTYAWTLTSPNGSTATLSDATAGQPSVIPDLPGDYVASLTVNDGTTDSPADTVTITVQEPANQVPVADAGPDAPAAVGDAVNLDGTGSTDPDGDELTYAWTLTTPDGSTAELDSSTTAQPGFVADVAGTYSAILTVNDGTTDSPADTVTITITHRPVADAGGDQAVIAGATVTLDGTGSTDPDGDTLTYAWSLTDPDGSGVELSDPQAAEPTFTATEVGDYTATLTVTDGQWTSTPDTITITASPNQAPVAAIQLYRDAAVGQTMILSSNGSYDPDTGNSWTLTYQWTLEAPDGSDASLDYAEGYLTRFTADVPGTYTATLVVNDGFEDSPPATYTTTIGHRPVADAGPGTSGVTGEPVLLDGTNSTDEDGDDLTFRWTLAHPSGSESQMKDPTSPTPRFTPDIPGDYLVSLAVDDGRYSSGTSKFITVTDPVNQAPVADAGPDQTALAGDVITLDGSGSTDPDGDEFTYAWTLTPPDGSTAELDDPTGEQPGFVADVAGTYTASLIANDGIADSPADTTTITVVAPNQAPVAKLDLVTDGAIGERLLLVGYYSTDPDGDDLTYTWDFQTPDGSSATLENPIASTARFVPDVAGDYSLTLVVNDGHTDSVPATITRTIGHRPVAVAGPDRSAVAGDSVKLDGTASSDGDGDDLSYDWLFLPPDGSNAALDDPTSATPSFTPDIAGTYRIRLVVHDGRYGSHWDWLFITVTNPPNEAPVADAGTDQTAMAWDFITLDGTGSTDPDGDELTYAWALTPPENSTAALDDPTAAQPSFTAYDSGTYTATLTVTDQWGATSATDTVTITVLAEFWVYDVTVGKDLQVNPGWMFNGSLPEPVDVTVTIEDESIAVVSPDRHTVGTDTLTLEVDAGFGADLMDMRIQGLAAGSTTATVTATGYPDSTIEITVVPDIGFSFGTDDFVIDESAENLNVWVDLHPLDADGNILHRQGLRAGLDPVTISLTNSDDTVGTLTESSVVFGADESNGTTQFDPASAGSTQISFTQPDGFTEPADGRSSITATVAKPEIKLGGITTGTDLMQFAPLTLVPAPTEPVDVTLTVDDPSIAVLSQSGFDEGSTTIVLDDRRSPETTYAVHGIAAGTTTVTASAPGYPDATATMTVNGAGLHLVLGDFTTAANSPTSIIYLTPYALDSSGGLLEAQSLRPGASHTVHLNNSNETVGTLTEDEFHFTGGTGRLTTFFAPAAVGTSTLSFVQPEGFTDPTNGRSSVTATVVEPQILVSDVTVGVGQVSAATARFVEAPTDPTRLGVWLDGSIFPDGDVLALLSHSPDGPWVGSIDFQDVADTSEHTFYVQGVAEGTAPLKAEGRPFLTAQSQLTVLPAGPALTGLSVGTLHPDRIVFALSRRELPVGVRATSSDV